VGILNPLKEHDYPTLNIGHAANELCGLQDPDRLGLYTHPFMTFGPGDASQLFVLYDLGGNVALVAPSQQASEGLRLLGRHKQSTDLTPALLSYR
jgi:hypothetical protein